MFSLSNYNLKVACPSYGKEWYVVWDAIYIVLAMKFWGGRGYLSLPASTNICLVPIMYKINDCIIEKIKNMINNKAPN